MGSGKRRKPFSSRACEQLKFYVYLYSDPRDGRPFYVGKGVGNRCFAHSLGGSGSRTRRRVREIGAAGAEPVIEILKYGLTEREALLVEATAIDLLGLGTLTNEVRGFGSRETPRGRVDTVAAILDARPVKVREPAILININQLYRHDLTPHELYDATRSAWKVGAKRARAKLALSVYRGTVREVYEISTWVEGGTTMKAGKGGERPRVRKGRWEFVGQVAEEAVRRRYVGRSVAEEFKRGAQNPVKYVNC